MSNLDQYPAYSTSVKSEWKDKLEKWTEMEKLKLLSAKYISQVVT